MDLPNSVQEIADVIGREKALLLVGKLPRCYAGGPGKKSWRVILYVPKVLRANHPLVEILGWHDAQALVREFAGMILQPANCNHIYRRHRNRVVRDMASNGCSVSEISEAVQLTPRQVRNILAEIPQQDRAAANDNTAPKLARFKR